jgi:uncharacterized protein YgiM (DUF1202 family)
MPRRQYLAFVLIVILILAAQTTFAARANTLAFTPGCTGFVSRGGSILPDRDNTGRSREVFQFRVTDGEGNLIYENFAQFPLNERVVYEAGSFYAYALRPAANPLFIQVTSPAGNGLPAQTLYEGISNCYTLPGVGGDFVITSEQALLQLLLNEPLDGRTAPSVEANEVPPRPVNPPGLAELLPGYAIVNTDNLFLRSGDNADYTPVGIVDGGTRLVVLGSNGGRDDTLWWYVEVGGLRGWVKSEFLILRGDLRGLPIIPVTGQISQPTLYIGIDNPIRSVPMLGAGVVCVLPGGQLYPVIARDTAEASWYQLEVDCNGTTVRGWIPAEAGLLRNTGRVNIPVANP